MYAFEKAHTEYEYTALVRNPDKGAPVASVYPNIRLVYGTLDDVELLEKESASADIVLRKLPVFQSLITLRNPCIQTLQIPPTTQ